MLGFGVDGGRVDDDSDEVSFKLVNDDDDIVAARLVVDVGGAIVVVEGLAVVIVVETTSGAEVGGGVVEELFGVSVVACDDDEGTEDDDGSVGAGLGLGVVVEVVVVDVVVDELSDTFEWISSPSSDFKRLSLDSEGGIVAISDDDGDDWSPLESELDVSSSNGRIVDVMMASESCLFGLFVVENMAVERFDELSEDVRQLDDL